MPGGMPGGMPPGLAQAMNDPEILAALQVCVYSDACADASDDISL